jgi:hypothetical protein
MATGPVASSVTPVKSFTGSNGVFLYSAGFVALGPSAPIASVCPSGAAFAVASMPIMPPAPGRFSTITGWPRDSASLGPSLRAITSSVEPGANAAMIRIGFDG